MMRNSIRSYSRSSKLINTGSISWIQAGLFFFLFAAFFCYQQNYVLIPRQKLNADLPKGEIKDRLTPLYNAVYITVSRRTKSPWGNGCCRGPHIQLNDQFATIQDISYALSQEIDCPDGYICYPKVYLRVDKDIKMGLIDDIKKELRKRNHLIVKYIMET